MAISPQKLSLSQSFLTPGSQLLILDLVDEPEATRCPHVVNVFADDAQKTDILHRFKSSVAWKAQRTHDNIHPAKRRKLSAPQCDACRQTLTRPFVCLHCAYAGCWAEEHIIEHLEDEGHLFCVDVKSGAVYCSSCGDVIHEPIFDALFHATILAVDERNTRYEGMESRRKEPHQVWTPTPADASALENTTPIPCQARRGLLNLGQTCFLNVVLQSLIHNPILRNYFLGDKHNHQACESVDCTCCEMDKLFTEVYNTTTSAPFGPTTLLATTWRSASLLSGYAQHDAHECFIALRDAMHASARGSTEISCNCIIHAAFSGEMQSEVRCVRCGNVSPKKETYMEFSLALGEAGGPETLAGCLMRFTQQEKLGSKEYTCPKCGKASTEANKRLSIRKLPPILSFQFKRFEQSGGDKGSARKISTPVRIPSMINMAPYTSAAQSARAGPDNPFPYPGPESMYEYELFSVINHEGQIDNGHYTNFSRIRDEWYRFDDDKVTATSLKEMHASPVPIYMAFYVKRVLDYKPHTTPSYIRAREEEAVRERESEQREREQRAREERERMDIEREQQEKLSREVDDELAALV
ncbi:hypothetical protein OF83DRAFT_1199383 [Amylostereum chailletii]|nr:hypothetical protein OF83DRAFT_1199383 [Amylostereum chailletii]